MPEGTGRSLEAILYRRVQWICKDSEIWQAVLQLERKFDRFWWGRWRCFAEARLGIYLGRLPRYLTSVS
jgi:hypothetical protein